MIRTSPKIELLRLDKGRLIAVRGAVHQQDLVTLTDGLAVQHMVLRRRAAHVEDRCHPPNQLLDSTSFQQGIVGPNKRKLLWVVEDGEESTGDDVATRLRSTVE